MDSSLDADRASSAVPRDRRVLRLSMRRVVLTSMRRVMLTSVQRVPRTSMRTAVLTSMRSARRGLVAIGFLALCGLTFPASAQSTGGRVGGVGSGGSTGSSYRYRPATSSSSGSASTVSSADARRAAEARAASNASFDAWTARRSRAGEAQLTDRERALVATHRALTLESWLQGLVGFGVGFGGMLVLGALVFSFLPARRATRRISIGFGPEARPVLQRRLTEIAANASPQTHAGRRALVTATLALLRSQLADARYVVWQEHDEPKAKAESRFFAAASDLRARYRHETVGAARAARPELAPKPDEGPGLVVVSLLVLDGAPRGLPTTLDLDAALAAFERVDLGVELIWSPAQDEDRMSSAELETLYPELVRIADDVGRVPCSFCGAIHAHELGRCPACGAEVRARNPVEAGAHVR